MIQDSCNDYDQQTGECFTCYQGYYLNNQDCKPLNPLCQKGDSNGNCISCYKDYNLVGSNCVPIGKAENDPNSEIYRMIHTLPTVKYYTVDNSGQNNINGGDSSQYVVDNQGSSTSSSGSGSSSTYSSGGSSSSSSSSYSSGSSSGYTTYTT